MSATVQELECPVEEAMGQGDTTCAKCVGMIPLSDRAFDGAEARHGGDL